METLKPCPFCGGEAELTSRIVSSGQTLYRYRCASCHAAIGRWHGGISGHDYTAAETWNTRAERTCCNKKDDYRHYFKGYYFVCSECGWSIADSGNVGLEVACEMIRICPSCGAKVVE